MGDPGGVEGGEGLGFSTLLGLYTISLFLVWVGARKMVSFTSPRGRKTKGRKKRKRMGRKEMGFFTRVPAQSLLLIVLQEFLYFMGRLFSF